MKQIQTPEEMDWTPKRIRILRQKMGLSQREFAEHINVRQATVSDWETGKHPPTGAVLVLFDMLEKQVDIES